MPDPFQNPNPLDPSKVKVTPRCGHGRTVYHDEPCPWCEAEQARAERDATEKACKDFEAWLDDALEALGVETVFQIKDAAPSGLTETEALVYANAIRERDEARDELKDWLSGAQRRWVEVQELRRRITELEGALERIAGPEMPYAPDVARQALASTPQPSAYNEERERELLRQEFEQGCWTKAEYERALDAIGKPSEEESW